MPFRLTKRGGRVFVLGVHYPKYLQALMPKGDKLMRRFFSAIAITTITGLIVWIAYTAHAGSSASQGCKPVRYGESPTPPQPASRTVNVNVPIPSSTPACSPYSATTRGLTPVCTPAGGRPTLSTPVRVEVIVRPELQSGAKSVPVEIRDAGPVRPIVAYSVGLVGAAVAAPFRMLELLFPSPASSENVSGPPSCPRPVGGTSVPTPCLPICSYRPVEPAVAPLPGVGCTAPHGHQLPPALLSEYQFPPLEHQSLLMGILSLPWRIATDGRFLGDLQSER